ncbi:SH3 domain-containing protein [Lysinibacillus sphaericus]
MGVRQLDSYFINANSEYHQIEQDLKHRLNTSVSEEVIAFIQVKTNEAMEQVWGILHARYEDLKRLDESMPDKPSKEDQTNYLKEFFRLTDPARVSADLKTAIKFTSIESDYMDFIKAMSGQEHGEIFKRYTYPSEFFNGLKNAIVYHIDQLTAALKEYAEMIGKHAILLDTLNKGKKEKAFIKGGASLLGMLVGIPFAGAGVGALMGGNDEDQVNDSLNKVFTNWNTYIEQFNKFINSLEENYRLAMMTIYGGTIIRVSDQFHAMEYAFAEMSLLEYQYYLTLTDKEKKESGKWIEETTAGVTELLKRKSWKEALRVSQKLFHIVKQRPITSRTELQDGKSGLYIAHLFYYSSYQEALLEEYRNGHLDSFYSMTKQLYNELLLLVQDKDLEKSFSTSGHLLFRFVKEALKRKEMNDLSIVSAFFQRVEDRGRKEGYYLGELPGSPKEVSEQFKAFMLIEEFLEKVYSIGDSHGDEDGPDVYLSRKTLKELKMIDDGIGVRDELSAYIKKEYIKSILMPWRGVSFTWYKQNKKRLAGFLLIIALLFSGVTYGKDLLTYSKNVLGKFSWPFSSEASTPEEGQPVNYMQITSEFGNIRSEPSLTSAVVYSADSSDELQFLNEKQKDQDDRIWFKVQAGDGTEGWISSKIIKKVEE